MFQAEKCMESEPRISKLSVSIFGLLTVILCFLSGKAVMEKCCLDDIHGYIALHTVTTLWYIMRRIPDGTRRLALKSLCEMLTVAVTTHEEVTAALDNS